MAVVYCIKDKQTGKCYVGKTMHPLKARWREHCAGAKASSLIGRVIAASGAENFEISVLETMPDSDALACEGYWIVKLGTIWPGGYNVASGSQERRRKERIKLAEAAAPPPVAHSLEPSGPHVVPLSCDLSMVGCYGVCDRLQIASCRLARDSDGVGLDALARLHDAGALARNESLTRPTEGRR